MAQSSKLLSRVLMSAALAVPLSMCGLVFGQDMNGAAPTTTTAPSAAVGPVDPALVKSADDFWHYVSVARYELATAEAKKLVDNGGDGVAVLRAFESVAADRKQDLDHTMEHWLAIDGVKDAAKSLSDLLDKGRLTMRSDQAYIEENIKRLIVNERAYETAVSRLRNSGELAVPLMVSYLRNPERSLYHGSIRRALTDMGKSALSPLLAATEMKDQRVLPVIVTILGDLGYDPAVPYLLRVAASPDSASSVRSAAAAALAKLGASGSVAPAQSFYELGEKFYYGNSLITADLSQAPVAYVWYWSESTGLTKRDVPPAIFNDVMSMRAAEYSLTADRGQAQALSLWLAANYKREVDLPAGATDATRNETLTADAYGVDAGARYLNDVLTRTLKDHNSAVALKAVRSLSSIVGESSLFTSGNATPLTAALSYPDRLVRFEAAYAVASSMPKQAFPGSDQVVPILGEIVAQTGKPGILVVALGDEAVNKWVADLQAQGFDAAGAQSVEGAINAAAKLPSVDAVVISEDVGLAVVDGLLAAGDASPKLARTPKVIITKTTVSPYASRAAVDIMVNTTQATDVAGVKDAVVKARARGGANPLDEAGAKDAALKALGLLKELSIAKVPTLNLIAARPTLIAALDDARPEVVKASAEVLALMGEKEGQLAILIHAVGEKTPDELKVPLLTSLSTSAKTYGNTLPADAIASLQALIDASQNGDVRTHAAEARGALNLPPDEAKNMIIKQARF